MEAARTVQVRIKNVEAISAGYSHSLALKTDGTVWAWGYNGFGEVKPNFRSVLATEERAALEWTTGGASSGDAPSYEGVSILEMGDGKVRRFMAYFDTRDRAAGQVVG